MMEILLTFYPFIRQQKKKKKKKKNNRKNTPDVSITCTVIVHLRLHVHVQYFC